MITEATYKALLMKSFLRHPIVVNILGYVIWLWMALINRTIRWQIEGDTAAKDVWANSTGIVVAAWHSRILLLPAGWTREIGRWPGRTAPSAMLISLSADGEPVARAIKHLGLEAIRGSASNKKKATKDKGGARAIASAVRRLKSGGAVCITPDGPRGPAEIVSPGAILLAMRSGAPILPYALASSPAKRLGTWDRFIIPFPFTKGAIVFGPPIHTSRDDDPIDLQAQLQQSLDIATARAEAIVGQAPLQSTRTKYPKTAGLYLYSALTSTLTPFLGVIFRRRAKRGKEDAARYNERIARTLPPRPVGPLVWLHGASIGESQILMDVGNRLRGRSPDLTVLITTQTLTSATLIGAALPANTIHQMAPVDTPAVAKRFIAHWQPDACIFGEGEIWPNLIMAAQNAGAKCALVNARMTKSSLKGWQRWGGIARKLLAPFDVILAADKPTAKGLSRILGHDIHTPGNLKTALRISPPTDAMLDNLANAFIGPRKCLLAASTHPGEDDLFLDAIKDLPETVGIIAPRHPDRADSIRKSIESRGLTCAQRSLGEIPTRKTDILLADTVGEMGLWYSLADAVYLGGAHTAGVGGHNPLEAIRFSKPVVTGPDAFNFSAMMDDLEQQHLITRVPNDAAALQQALADAPPPDEDVLAELATEAEAPMNTTIDALAALLPVFEPKS